MQPAYYENLEEIQNKYWFMLDDAVTNRSSPFRIPVFICAHQDEVDGRIVVLRKSDRTNNLLQFHTDLRSPKVDILKKNNNASLVFYDKEEKKYGFAKVRDAQYHMALYELLAELNNKHCAILKKRQIASSYFHMGKIINTYWFEEGSVCKIGASLKDYINDKGSWKFLDEYKTFLNEHTAWYRPSTPEKVLLWEQKIEVRAVSYTHLTLPTILLV